MCSKLNVIDIENIRPIHFRSNRSSFEEMVYRKFRYPEIFELLTEVNAHDLISARKLEEQRFSTNRDALVLFNSQAGELLKEDMTTESGYNVVKKWVFGLDDCRYDCYTTGGKCDEIFDALSYIRKNTFSSLAEIDKVRGYLPMCEHLYDVCDQIYSEMTKSKLAAVVRSVETKYVVPFILSSSENDIIECLEVIDKDGEMTREFAEYALKYIRKISSQADDGAAEKLRFLGKRYDMLTKIKSG